MGLYGVYVRLSPDELEALRAAPDRVSALVNRDAADPGRRRYDLDRAWQAIWYLLRRAGAPTRAIMEGSPLWRPADDGDEDVPSVFSPEEVKRAAAWLAEWPAQRIASYFDRDAFAVADIYPQIWNSATEPDPGGWLLSRYAGLPAYFAEAAETGDALLLWVG